MDLKDHFREVYKSRVVFASISKDMETGLSKGCGLVQFEGPKDAERAITEMDGSYLAGVQIGVRGDRQERRAPLTPRKPSKIKKIAKTRDSSSSTSSKGPINYTSTMDDDTLALSDDVSAEIQELVEEREKCRGNKQYDDADEIRLKLQQEFNVQIDDTRKKWRVLYNE
jgi:RNA recognition motif-containing protein